MLEKSVNNGNEFGGLLTDLSEAFDCTDHKLLIGKLFWCGVSPAAFNVTHSHLTSRTQKLKNNKSFSRQRSIFMNTKIQILSIMLTILHMPVEKICGL